VPTTEAYPALRGSFVLLAEDERWMREHLRARLAAHGCLAITTDSVAATRAALRSRTFAVAVLDLTLRDGRVDALLPELRRGDGPDPIVVVLTALDDPSALTAWHDIGARVLLKFEFDPATLPAIVAESVERFQDRVTAIAHAQLLETKSWLRPGPVIVDASGRIVDWDEVCERYLSLLPADARSGVSDPALQCLRLLVEGVPVRSIGERLEPRVSEEAVKKRLARLRQSLDLPTTEDLLRVLRVSVP
jgi:DNA-binding response OmpR family regulator